MHLPAGEESNDDALINTEPTDIPTSLMTESHIPLSSGIWEQKKLLEINYGGAVKPRSFTKLLWLNISHYFLFAGAA